MPELVTADRWEDRLREDRARAARFQSRQSRAVTAEVLRRAVNAGAHALALTGSTARGHRTAISDLDFHLVGPRPDLGGLSGEVDLVADSRQRLQRRLAEGDDFIQWTVRLGCILHDPNRIFQNAQHRIEAEGLWPDPQRKYERAEALGQLAERVISVGDRDATQEHVRAALTSLARGLLLANAIFPLARDELAAQLRELGFGTIAEWLHRSIHDLLSLTELRVAVVAVQRVVSSISDSDDSMPEAA